MSISDTSRPPVRVAFRADGSSLIGIGHVMRCLSLALAWRERGADVVFISRDLDGFPTQLLRDNNITLRLLPKPSQHATGVLGVNQDRDFQETLDAIGSKVDWLVVDHYGIDIEWERLARAAGLSLLVLDDAPGRPHVCEAFLDQNTQSNASGYRQTLEGHPRLFLGPSFALVRREFPSLRSTAFPRSRIRRILVSLGGADPDNVTGSVLQGLDAFISQGGSVDVVVGPSSRHADSVEAVAASLGPNARVLRGSGEMQRLMLDADLMIGAGGGTSWERCCLALPALLISIADNQVPGSRELDRRAAARYLGPATPNIGAAVREAVEELRAHPERVSAMSRAARMITDGEGARRVAALLSAPPVTVRAATERDSRQVWEWANDRMTRSVSYNPKPIPWENHQSWFSGKLAEPTCLFLVGESGGEPVGPIRFDVRSEGGIVSVSLDAAMRGRGLGAELIRAGTAEFTQTYPALLAIAYVRADNVASKRSFENAGYLLAREEVVEGAPSYRFEFLA